MADWTNVEASYNEIYDTYIDEHEIVNIKEKQPRIGKIGLIVAGDSNSQFMTFEINRYYDNIDLSNKLIKISYLYEKDNEIKVTKQTKIYADNACNICYTDDKLRFSWLLPAVVANQEGKIAASVSFIGLNDELGYELKTTIFELEIQPSIASNGTLEKAAKVTWFGDVEARIYKLEQSSGLADLDYKTLVNKPKLNGVTLEDDVEFTFVERATQSELGGVKALPKEEDQTQPVGIDENGFLWVKPSSGGGGGGTGADGFSPIVSMQEEEGGTLLTIVDKNGIKTAHIKNGADGVNGVDGTNGKDGKDGINGINGVDGFSPVPKIETIEGGTRITITKKEGEPEEAFIPNGKDGKALIDDEATSGSDVSWSVDKIIAYVNKTMEDIENGTY